MSENIFLKEKIKKIITQWFYTEPLMFSVSETHVIIENKNLSVPLRSGKMCVEYSPDILENFSDHKIEFLLKVEFTRILLGHPYRRLPQNANYGILVLASDAVIWQFNLQKNKFKADCFNDADFLELAGVQYLRQQAGCRSTFPDMNFEQWYKFILDLVSKSKGGQSSGKSDEEDFKLCAQAGQLWQEDENALNDIKSKIRQAEIENGFGSAGSSLIRELKAESNFSFDYRRALSQFRQQIVSAERRLTRMKPSRRYGFNAMGSRYERKANVLVAVDVSGSITDESFSNFVHAVKNFFFLGIIEKIELIFFDVNLKNTKPVAFSKKISLDKIKGRGGTDFQPAVDFFCAHKSFYSGMIIFTDGEGSVPDVYGNGKNILWILDSRLNYEKSRHWIEKGIFSKATYLPF
ncbi:MAG: VWA-like domain-containing protein [Treponema sp.]